MFFLDPCRKNDVYVGDRQSSTVSSPVTYVRISDPGHKFGLVSQNNFFLWEKAGGVQKNFASGQKMTGNGCFLKISQFFQKKP